MTIQEKIDEIANEYVGYRTGDMEAIDILYIAADILSVWKKQLEATESYAFVTIDKLETGAEILNDVATIYDFFEEYKGDK